MAQSDEILHFLQQGWALTPLDALRNFGCMRLAARINELRREGHAIRTETMRTLTGKRVARYRLVEEPKQAEMF